VLVIYIQFVYEHLVLLSFKRQFQVFFLYIHNSFLTMSASGYRVIL